MKQAVIQTEQVIKKFGDFRAIDEVSLSICEGSIYGMVGSNGSGKSTLLRLLAGVYRPDGGTVLVGGVPVYENVKTKERIAYLSDEPFFLLHATIEEMKRMFAAVYTDFSEETFRRLLEMFGLPTDRKIATFSKGMQKQTAMLLALSTRPSYLLCDETFDGLDPVMRQFIKRILAGESAERGMTTVIATHNLRETEDIADHIGLLHTGRVVLESDTDDLKLGIHKVQMIPRLGADDGFMKQLEIVKAEERGSLKTLIVRGERDEISAIFAAADPLFYELIPLTLEEIFIYEMGEKGYDLSGIEL